ncbi:MAG: hypothetical protein KDA57_06665 [Planctomycetales bacterium]|nr:hypothetical protein [Planctomycetales bacterium]
MQSVFLTYANEFLPMFAQGMPVIDSGYVIQVASRVLHLVSAMILVGGLFYLRTVLSPAGEEAYFAGRRAIWAKWVGITSGLLLVTGIYNLMQIIGQSKAAEVKLPPTYHMLFGIKFLLAILVMFLAAILAGKTAAADRFRSQMSKWLNVAWLASLLLIVLAAMLKTFH